MTAQGIGEHGTEGLVVDIARTIIGGAGVTQIGLQRLLVGDRQHMHQIEGVLLIQVLQVAVVVAAGQAVAQLVVTTGEDELVGQVGTLEGDPAQRELVQGHVFVIAGITVVDLVQITGIEGQTGDVLGNDVAAAEHLRQQAAIAGTDGLVLQLQRTDLEHALASLGLGGQAEAAGVVLGTFGRLVRYQQAAAGGAVARIQLETESSQRVDAKTQGAFGVARLHAQQEALRPLFLLGLAGVFTEITIEIEVAQLQAGLAAADQVGRGRLTDHANCYGQG
ncbi:hypothetical protein D3C80_1047120 [compost metagenome]